MLILGSLISGLCAALALAVQHLALYRHPWRLARPVAFMLGLATILLFLTFWAIWADQYGPVSPLLVALAAWIISGCGGSVVVVAYWWRSRLARWEADALDAGAAAMPKLRKGAVHGTTDRD
jgi:hypothetical protein